MAATNWYFTSTAFSGLSGYLSEPAHNEVQLSTTAPGSGTLSASITKGTTEAAFIGGSDSPPHESTDLDWNALTAADSQMSIDVNSTHADLTLTTNTRYARMNSSGAQQAIDNSGTWDSSSGTGVKVWTAVGDFVDGLGTAATTDIVAGIIYVANAGHMDPQTIVINLGSSTYVEFRTLVVAQTPYRNPYPQLLAH